MHSVCCCSLPVWRRSFLKKGTPMTYFSRPGSAPARIWPKNNNTCKGPWVLHPYQVSLKSIKRFWRRSWTCESLRTTTTTTDGRAGDGRCAMTIAHLSLRLRWAKKQSDNTKTSPKTSITKRLRTGLGRSVGLQQCASDNFESHKQNTLVKPFRMHTDALEPDAELMLQIKIFPSVPVTLTLFLLWPWCLQESSSSRHRDLLHCVHVNLHHYSQ